MEDKRHYIDQVQALSRGYNGRELSPAELALEFAKHDVHDRVTALDGFERERTSGEPLSIREAARRLAFERALRDTHKTLRKVDR
jgi:hypothetical protein